MAGRPYSHRFAISNGSVVARYTVPVGWTAVVKCMTGVNGAVGAQNIGLMLGNIYLWVGTIQANAGLTQAGLQVVYYGGESMGVYGTATGVVGSAHGYLLEGSAAVALDDPPFDVVVEDLPEAALLPAA